MSIFNSFPEEVRNKVSLMVNLNKIRVGGLDASTLREGQFYTKTIQFIYGIEEDFVYYREMLETVDVKTLTTLSHATENWSSWKKIRGNKKPVEWNEILNVPEKLQNFINEEETQATSGGDVNKPFLLNERLNLVPLDFITEHPFIVKIDVKLRELSESDYFGTHYSIFGYCDIPKRKSGTLFHTVTNKHVFGTIYEQTYICDDGEIFRRNIVKKDILNYTEVRTVSEDIFPSKEIRVLKHDAINNIGFFNLIQNKLKWIPKKEKTYSDLYFPRLLNSVDSNFILPGLTRDDKNYFDVRKYSNTNINRYGNLIFTTKIPYIKSTKNSTESEISDFYNRVFYLKNRVGTTILQDVFPCNKNKDSLEIEVRNFTNSVFLKNNAYPTNLANYANVKRQVVDIDGVKLERACFNEIDVGFPIDDYDEDIETFKNESIKFSPWQVIDYKPGERRGLKSVELNLNIPLNKTIGIEDLGFENRAGGIDSNILNNSEIVSYLRTNFFINNTIHNCTDVRITRPLIDRVCRKIIATFALATNSEYKFKLEFTIDYDLYFYLNNVAPETVEISSDYITAVTEAEAMENVSLSKTINYKDSYGVGGRNYFKQRIQYFGLENTNSAVPNPGLVGTLDKFGTNKVFSIKRDLKFIHGELKESFGVIVSAITINLLVFNGHPICFVGINSSFVLTKLEFE